MLIQGVKKQEVKDDSKIFGVSKQKDGVVINWGTPGAKAVLKEKLVMYTLSLRCLLDGQKIDMSNKEVQIWVQVKSPGCRYKFGSH